LRLADFITRDMENILVHWQAFAATCLPAAASMTPLALRDHSEAILQAVAKDLSTAQTRDVQAAKSQGLIVPPAGAPETAAQAHAVLRAKCGFDIDQLASEYRALRAAVLRLWIDDCQPQSPHLDDLIRFNEAIDQALAESISVFSAQIDQARNLLLGMLGHDMRSPLQAIQMTSTYLAQLNAGSDVGEAAALLIRSGSQMQHLLDDLVDFSRTRLGLGIRVVPAEVDVAVICQEEIDLLRRAYPECTIELKIAGDTLSCCDGPRLQQVLGNLVVNAVKYGTPDLPVEVFVNGQQDDICIEVRNQGPTIAPATLERIFHPLQRGDELPEPATDGSLGLGLFIAQEIVSAHGGKIEANSDKAETTFRVSLPRVPVASCPVK
jgi:signal transduction histidine kinase